MPQDREVQGSHLFEFVLALCVCCTALKQKSGDLRVVDSNPLIMLGFNAFY